MKDESLEEKLKFSTNTKPWGPHDPTEKKLGIESFLKLLGEERNIDIDAIELRNA